MEKIKQIFEEMIEKLAVSVIKSLFMKDIFNSTEVCIHYAEVFSTNSENTCMILSNLQKVKPKAQLSVLGHRTVKKNIIIFKKIS